MFLQVRILYYPWCLFRYCGLQCQDTGICVSSADLEKYNPGQSLSRSEDRHPWRQCNSRKIYSLTVSQGQDIDRVTQPLTVVSSARLLASLVPVQIEINKFWIVSLKARRSASLVPVQI